MATAITTLATNVVSPVNYQLMRGLLSAARKKLPYFNGSLPGTLAKQVGAPAVIWQRVNNLTAVTTAIGEVDGNSAWQNGRTLVRPVVSTVTATPLKYGNAIQLTEEIDLIQPNANSMKFMDTLGANAGESLNELMVNVYKGATARNAGAASTITSITTAISANDIKYCVNQLNRNSAMSQLPIGTGSTNIGSSPIREAYYGICHPDVEEDIRGITNFLGVEQYAGYTATLPGEFGALNGVRWCTSELAGVILADSGGNGSVATLRATTTITACDLYDTFIYGREAIGSVGLGAAHAFSSKMMYDTIPAVEVIQHGAGSAGAGDPYNEIITLAWKAWFTGAILNPTWVYRIRSGATSLSAA